MADESVSARRRVRDNSTFGAAVVLITVLLGLVNYLGWKYHKRLDWTRSEIYSLSEKTENILAQLTQDIDVVVFMQPNDQLYPPVKELLARYEAATSRLTVREVDPGRNLAQAQELVDRYAIDSLNVILFESAGERRLVETKDLADYDYSGMQFGQGAPRMTGFKGEQSFTSALLELTQGESPQVLFTTGHGELQVEDFSPGGLSDAANLLLRDNFDVESWASLGQSEVPEGTELVVIAGPTGNFLEPELEALGAHLEAGGRLLVLIDPTLSPAGGLVETGLEVFLERYGITVGADIVVDPANPLPFFGADTIYVSEYGSHAITRPLDQAGLPVILSLARSVGLDGSHEGFETAELFLTSSQGWGETDLADLRAVQLDDADREGPVPLGVAIRAVSEAGPEEAVLPAEPTTAQEKAEDPPSDGERLVVIGDATFATNAQLQNVGNLTLFANIINWLAQREALVAIAPKTPESVRLSLSSSEIRGIFWFVVVGLPALVVAIGVFIHRRRQR
ncbi:MAG: GldG family protein [Acidobacteria bacterium]|nr:GldG family protein [Acidobacteriota bacterium]